MIKAIAFFVYPVTDLARARGFYEGVLGLKAEVLGGGRWIEYEVAGATFAISDMEMDLKPGAKGGTIAFEVNELEQTMAQLKSAQVKVLMDVFETPVCRMAVVTDPDGNEIIIHKIKS